MNRTNGDKEIYVDGLPRIRPKSGSSDCKSQVLLLQAGVTKIVIPHDKKTQEELRCYNHHMNLEIKPLSI